MRTLALALALFASSVFWQPAANGVIHVEIGGLRSNKGNVMCTLYASADGFPKDPKKAVAKTQSPVADNRAVCEFPGIHPGRYAVSAFHDENSNGKLDANLLGIPREGVAASNNAKGHMGPPKFGDAAFQFISGRLELKITMFYM